MNTKITNKILPTLLLSLLLVVSSPVYAESGPMTVVFTPNPIFGNVSNFLPGDYKTGTVAVSNNTGSVQSVYAESVNGFDPDGLGGQLRLQVFEGVTSLYDDTLADFLSAGPVSLSSISAGGDGTYTFKVAFIDSEDNDYQGKSLGFDLCIGFSGGNFQCGGTAVSPEGPVSPSTGSGSSGGGGGSSGGTSLIIFDEKSVPSIPNTISSVITWKTNKLSTSQVIYGLASGSYTLDINDLPCMGYPSCTPETNNPPKVIDHAVTISDLIPGETYVYRVVSRASPPTISPEYQFTLSNSGNQNIPIIVATSGSVETSENFSTSETEEISNIVATKSLGEENLAAAFLSDLDLSCIGVGLLLFLLMLAVVWIISRKKEYSVGRDITYFIILSLLISIILSFVSYTCPIPPLWIIVVVYIISRLITKKKKKV